LVSFNSDITFPCTIIRNSKGQARPKELVITSKFVNPRHDPKTHATLVLDLATFVGLRAVQRETFVMPVPKGPSPILTLSFQLTIDENAIGSEASVGGTPWDAPPASAPIERPEPATVAQPPERNQMLAQLAGVPIRRFVEAKEVTANPAGFAVVRTVGWG
jgi:hypothetical protein